MSGFKFVENFGLVMNKRDICYSVAHLNEEMVRINALKMLNFVIEARIWVSERSVSYLFGISVFLIFSVP